MPNRQASASARLDHGAQDYPRVVDFGVDWITGTTMDRSSGLQLQRQAEMVQGWELKGGGIKKPWGSSGFSGFKVGGAQLGRRDKEVMARLTSECARMHWRRVYQASENITRLDLQVTMFFGSDCYTRLLQWIEDAATWSNAQRKGPKVDWWANNSGGLTLYCGKRTSNRFGRAYLKGPESKLPEYDGCIRFEVQFNARAAMMVARAIAKPRAIETECFSRVFGFFRARAVQIPAPTVFIDNYSCPRRRSDVLQKLKWLQTSVSPSCKLLVERGMVPELIRALQLEEFVIIRPHSSTQHGPTRPKRR